MKWTELERKGCSRQRGEAFISVGRNKLTVSAGAARVSAAASRVTADCAIAAAGAARAAQSTHTLILNCIF